MVERNTVKPLNLKNLKKKTKKPKNKRKKIKCKTIRECLNSIHRDLDFNKKRRTSHNNILK